MVMKRGTDARRRCACEVKARFSASRAGRLCARSGRCTQHIRRPSPSSNFARKAFWATTRRQVTCSRDTSFCQDLNRVVCGGTREQKRNRERVSGRRETEAQVWGEKDLKAEKAMKLVILAAGITEPSGWHRGVHVFSCNYLHSCVRCAHVSLPQFCVTAARCLRAVSAPFHQGSANPLAIVTLPYTACSSPYLKTLPHAFNASTNIHNDTRNCKSCVLCSYSLFHRYPRAPS